MSECQVARKQNTQKKNNGAQSDRDARSLGILFSGIFSRSMQMKEDSIQKIGFRDCLLPRIEFINVIGVL